MKISYDFNALQIIGSFASKNQKFVRKANELSERVLKSFFEMLLDVPYQENISEWLATLGKIFHLLRVDETIENNENENCLFYIAKDALSKYAIAIGEHGISNPIN